MKTQVELDSLPGVELAVLRLNGKATALARLCRVSPQAVSLWRRKGVVPVSRVNQLSEMLGIPREKLNPVFGKNIQ